MLNGWTELQVYDRGSVSGDFYCKKRIFSYALQFRGAIGADFVLMDENSRPHQTADIQQLFERTVGQSSAEYGDTVRTIA
ncbi:hypothetical protein TNCV_4010461 [Trichonephila clavipes]|nr:hypothetical protein TNCV_4010461 [Trichonephila clavipes]